MNYKTILLNLTALLVSLSSVPAQTESGKADGLSAVHVGNSHSHPLRLLVPLAERNNHDGYKAGDINILGAALSWNWNHGEQNKWPETLAADKKWDAITLLSWGSDDTVYAPKFAGEFYKGNPQGQVYIYVIWPDSNMSFEQPDPIRTEAHGEEVAAAVTTAYPNSPKPRVIPSSLLMRELGRLADRGELPGVANRFELFADGGHLSQVGQYADIVLISAMLYGESPLNYPSDVFRKDGGGKPIRGMYQHVTMQEDTANVIKRTAWDILQTYQPAGMKPMLVIGNRNLDSAITGQPYKMSLKALNANGPCTWSLTKGTLPDGFSLSADGVISGQSKTAGKYPLTIKLVSGNDSFERSLTLNVNQDTPPSVPEQALPETSLDRYIFYPFKIDGGVEPVTWTISDGILPYGIMLSPAGILVGTPGEEGDFTFKVKVQDSHPAGPRTSEKEFKWKIGPARPDTLQVKYVITQGFDLTQIHVPSDADRKPIPANSVLKIDGKLDEPFWNLDQPIEKKVLGTPEKKASFAAIWAANCTGNTIPGKPIPHGKFFVENSGGRVWILDGSDLVLAIKVLDGPKGKTPKDGVHIYLDGRHDGKIIYGADDLHFFIPRDFKKNGEWAPMVRSLKAPWFSKAAVSEIEGGYTVEVSFGPANLTGDGQWLPLNAKSVYGMDIAVDEGVEGSVSQQVWRGDANDAEDTSHFGTIVLTGQSAVTPPDQTR